MRNILSNIVWLLTRLSNLLFLSQACIPSILKIILIYSAAHFFLFLIMNFTENFLIYFDTYKFFANLMVYELIATNINVNDCEIKCEKIGGSLPEDFRMLAIDDIYISGQIFITRFAWPYWRTFIDDWVKGYEWNQRLKCLTKGIFQWWSLSWSIKYGPYCMAQRSQAAQLEFNIDLLIFNFINLRWFACDDWWTGKQKSNWDDEI